MSSGGPFRSNAYEVPKIMRERWRWREFVMDNWGWFTGLVFGCGALVGLGFLFDHCDKVQKARDDRCREDSAVIDVEQTHTCPVGAKLEVTATGYGSRQLVRCLCPKP